MERDLNDREEDNKRGGPEAVFKDFDTPGNGWQEAGLRRFEDFYKTFDSPIYQRLVESIPVLVYVYNKERVIYVNSTVEKVLGYTREEMTKFRFWDICHEDFKEIVKERGYRRLSGEDAPADYEFKILKKNGEEIWVHVFFAVSTIAGEKVGIVGAYDITEAKRLKEELEQAHNELEKRVADRTRELMQKNQELSFLNENLNNIIENISDGILIVNEDGNINPLNSTLGLWEGEIIAAVKVHLKEEEKSRLGSMIKALMKDQQPFKDEELSIGEKTRSTLFLVSGVPLKEIKTGSNQGLLFIKPIREVHRLINKFSGARSRFTFDDIITEDESMKELIAFARSVAASNSNILIEGESGTGKEMFAQAIHNASPRCNGPFVAVNCGAIPRELVGSELFGYEEGAFTGARKGGSSGKFELANGGTLFLDEIGDMPFEQQVALLRVLQDKSIMRIGGDRIIPIDVRIICASNKPLRILVERGVFRADLYYRLNVISLDIPPLRTRPRDIRILFDYFLQRYSGKCRLKVDPEVYRLLMNYDWPGNVRELQNMAERVVVSLRGNIITVEDIPKEIIRPGNLKIDDKQNISSYRYKKLIQKELDEQEEMVRLLDKYKGNITRCAREMGWSRTTFYKKMKKYQL